MRQLIPALLLLTLLLPAAAAAQSPVTRVQFVAALWTCSGAVPYDANGPFSDVNPNSPGATAVAWAYDLGWRGTGGNFSVPDRPITREEAAVLLRRYAVHLGRDTFLPSGVAAGVTTLRGSLLGGRLPLLGRRHRPAGVGRGRQAGAPGHPLPGGAGAGPRPFF